MIWVDSEEKKRTSELTALLNNVTGPLGKQLIDEATECSATWCSSKGRCHLLPSSTNPPPSNRPACTCFDGYHGLSCKTGDGSVNPIKAFTGTRANPEMKTDDTASVDSLLRPTAVRGFHVDDEFCIGRLVDNETLQLTAYARFLGSLANKSATLAAASAHLPSEQRLILSVDVFPWWVCPQSSSCRPPCCGCMNITWKGYSKSVADHVVDIADEVVLMGFTIEPALKLDHALPADRLGASADKARPSWPDNIRLCCRARY